MANNFVSLELKNWFKTTYPLFANASTIFSQSNSTFETAFVGRRLIMFVL